MHTYQDLLNRFIQMSRDVLGHNLLGIYLHGSLAMGCFNPKKSDIDLLLVVQKEPSDEEKLAFMQQVILLNDEAPAKGLELSIVTKGAVNPFVYPTPFVLHFSPMHLGWFQNAPVGYVQKMKGTDPDLAAHCTIVRRYGIPLWGDPIDETFGQVPKSAYLDSIWQDVAQARTDILGDPMYITLNLCRVAAFVREDLCLSKQSGGEWGLNHLPDIYHGMIRNALNCYATDQSMTADADIATAFAAELLTEIDAARGNPS